MGMDLIPAPLHAKYQLAEYDHACAILARDFPTEFQDILDCLGGFVLKKTAILTPGGGRSPIPIAIDGFLHLRGWREKKFDIEITVDGEVIPIPTHKIDNFKKPGGAGSRVEQQDGVLRPRREQLPVAERASRLVRRRRHNAVERTANPIR